MRSNEACARWSIARLRRSRSASRRGTRRPRGRQGEDRDLRLRACSTWATTSTQNDPDWFDVKRPTKLPGVRRTSSARTADFYASVRQSRFGVKAELPDGDTASSRRCSSSSCSASASTPARRRSGCATPTASWDTSAPARPGARSWTSTCSRTRSSTGDRTAWSSSATSRSAGCRSQGDNERHDRARAARARAPTPASSRDRVELAGRQAALPGCPTSRRDYRMTGELGLRAARRHRPLHRVGRHARRRRSTSTGHATGWGVNAQLEHQARQGRRSALPVVYGEGIENYMNDAPVDVGVRDATPATPSRRSTARRCRSSASSRSSTTPGTTSCTSVDRLLAASTSTTPTARRPTRSSIGQYALANLLYYPGDERDDRRRVPVGPPREQLATASASNDYRIQFSFKYSFSTTIWRRPVMNAQQIAVASLAAGARRARGRASLAAARRADARRRSRRRARTRPTRSTRTSRKARTPTTSRRSPRSISNIFGIALVTADGKVYTAGDIKSEVSIQSISKVFTMARVIQESGADAIENNIGVDATGQAFNSIVAIEQYKGAEMNPLVNPGAITTTSMVKGATPRRDLEQDPRHATATSPAARSTVNQEVFKSEAETNQRNQAIGDADVRLRPHQGQPAAGDRHLHRAVLGQRQREGSRDDGGDARQRRQESGHRQAGHEGRERARGARGDGDRRPLRRLRQVAVSRPACPAKSGVGGGLIAVSPGQVRHRGDLAAARQGRQQRARRRRRSPTSRTRSAATRTRRARSSDAGGRGAPLP